MILFPLAALFLFSYLTLLLSFLIPQTNISILLVVFSVSALGAIVFCFKTNGKILLNVAEKLKHPDIKTTIGHTPTLISYLIFAPGILILLFSISTQISYHGAFHNAYVYQIINIGIPPTNVVLPGYPANIYWLYHSLLAVISVLFSIAPPQSSVIVNVFSLILSLAILHRLLSELGIIKNKLSLNNIYPIYILFGINIFGAVYFLINNINSFGGDAFPLFKHQALLLFADVRLASMYAKFLNYNGFPIGVLFFIVSLYAAYNIINKKRTNYWIFLLLIFIISAILYHTTTGLFIAITIPISLTADYLYNLYSKNKIKRSPFYYWRKINDFKKYVLLLILLVPAIFFVYKSALAIPAKTQLTALSKFNIRNILLIISPAIPILFIKTNFKYKKIERFNNVIITSTLLGLFYSYIFLLPDNNQYKFAMLSSILINFFIILRLSSANISKTSILSKTKRFIAIIYISLVLINISVVSLIYAKSASFSKKTYSYDGIHTNHYNNKDSQKNNIYSWIRGNTPNDTLVVAPQMSKNTSPILLASERLAYVSEGYIYSEGIGGFAKRKKEITTLYSGNIKPKRIKKIIKQIVSNFTGKNIIILIPTTDKNLINTVKISYKPLFKNKSFMIFQLSRKAQQ